MSVHLADKQTVWFQSFTGKKIFPLEFEPEMVDIRDICHSLAIINRYAGHSDRPYSVAEHLINCISYARKIGASYETRINCLTHDFAEAYIQDIISPIKRYLHFKSPVDGSVGRTFTEVEQSIEEAIHIALDLPFPFTQQCKDIDLLMLATERRDIVTNPLIIDYEFIPEAIKDWRIDKIGLNWQEAESELLRHTKTMISLWKDVKKGREQNAR